jgi:hypothetical protein
MKYLKILLSGIVLFFSGAFYSQVAVSITVGSPPAWGPVGYSDAYYYYLPDVEAYYDVRTSMFIYFGNGVWVRHAYLPRRHRHYDLYSGYKVVMVDYRGNEPYYNFREYKVKYKKGYRGPSQKTIGEKPGRGNAGKSSGKEQRQQQSRNSSKHQQGGMQESQKHQQQKPQENKGGKQSRGGGGKGKK